MHCKASPSHRAAAFSHLLTPEYVYNPTGSEGVSPNSVYRDCGGHLHDPDYHQFAMPSSPPYSRSRTAPVPAYPSAGKFAWELEAAALNYEEDEEEELQRRSSSSMRRSFDPSRRSSLDDYDSTLSSPSSPAWPSTPSSFDYDEFPEEEEYDEEHSAPHEESDKHASASLALRKQWLAVSLRVKVKVYRAKKRLTHHANT